MMLISAIGAMRMTMRARIVACEQEAFLQRFVRHVRGAGVTLVASTMLRSLIRS